MREIKLRVERLRPKILNFKILALIIKLTKLVIKSISIKLVS